MNEQEEIIDLIEQLKAKHCGKRGGKLYGDICMRVVHEHLSRHLSKVHCKVSSPNAYVAGIPTEFDLLIVKSHVAPFPFTNAYSAEDILAVIEVKAHGVFGGKETLERVVGKIKSNFDKVREAAKSISFYYLTISEVSEPKKMDAINYFNQTKKYMAPYKVFCLKDSRTNRVRTGEWDSFLEDILGTIERSPHSP
jgi:hypothetical protein